MTAAAHGIELGIAAQFVEEGARVVACTRDSSKPRSEEDSPVDVMLHACNLGVGVDLERVVEDTSRGGV